MSDDRRAGFTLVELVVAIAVAGLLILGAHAMLAQLAATGERILAITSAADRTANAERVLRSLVVQVESNALGEPALAGTSHEARFVSWCDSRGGWKERCEVILRVEQSGVETSLTVLQDGVPVAVLDRGQAIDGLRYLYSAGDGGSWVESWDSRATIPLAIGVVMRTDTLILRIGARG